MQSFWTENLNKLVKLLADVANILLTEIHLRSTIVRMATMHNNPTIFIYAACAVYASVCVHLWTIAANAKSALAFGMWFQLGNSNDGASQREQ